MFELNITCSKDIDELSINFSDGTVKTSKSVKNKKCEIPYVENPELLNTETDFNVHASIMKLPKINEINRMSKVAPELQNLDI